MKSTKHIIPPCKKCPYQMGYIKTVVDPCPRCKRNGYSSYDWFLNGMLEKVVR